MKARSLAIALLAVAAAATSLLPRLASAADAAPAKPDTTAAKPAAPARVQVTTSMGSFVIQLDAERAPLTVAHFLKYVDQGFYSGTIFHRVIPGFVIQGGGFDTNYKLKGPVTRIVNESGNGLVNARGTVGLARPGTPHDGDVQFYVNLADNSALDPNPARWGYAVFGRVVQGMEVVDRIGNVATGAKGPFKEDAPLDSVIIERIERVTSP